MHPFKKRTTLAMGYMTQQILAMVGANVVRWGKDPQLCELSVTHTVLMKAKNS